MEKCTECPWDGRGSGWKFTWKGSTGFGEGIGIDGRGRKGMGFQGIVREGRSS